MKRELRGDTWTIKRQDLRNPSHCKQYMDRKYPANTAPSPEEVGDLDDIDLEAITYAEEIALTGKYEDVLWGRGNRRENLQRLTDIWAGTVDPAEDRVQRSYLYHMLSDVSSNARQTLAKNFETMGDIVGWVCYGRNHSHMDGISEAAAQQIRDARPEFVRYFGGEEYIPEYDDGYLTFDEVVVDEEQQTLGATK